MPVTMPGLSLTATATKLHRDTSSSILTDEGPSTLLTQGEGSGSGPAIFLEELEQEWEKERERPSAVEIEARIHSHALASAEEDSDREGTGRGGRLAADAHEEIASRFYLETERSRGAEEMKPKRAEPVHRGISFEGEDSGSGESVLVEIFPNAKISVEITLTKLTSMEPLDGPFTGNTCSRVFGRPLNR